MTDGINKRLGLAIKSMPNPTKDTKAYNYKYETLDQVIGIVQGALMAKGLFCRQGMEKTQDGYELRTYVIDMDSDISVDMLMDSRPLRFTGDPQKDGSAETYARRYALKTCFGLCGEDDDGAAASKPRSIAEKNSKEQQKPNTSNKTAESLRARWNAVVGEYAECVGDSAANVARDFLADESNDGSDEWKERKIAEIRAAIEAFR